MAGMNWPWWFLIRSLCLLFLFPASLSQSNIETFYPFCAPSPAPSPSIQIPVFPPIPSPLTPEEPPQRPPVRPPAPSSSDSTVVKAVAITAASTVVVSVLLFFLLHKLAASRRIRKDNDGGSAATVTPQPLDNFSGVDGNVRGLIVDENGLDVVYWRKLNKKSFHKAEKEEVEEEEANVREGRRSKKVQPIQEIPLLRGKSSSSHIDVEPERITSFPVMDIAPSILEKEKLAPPPPAIPTKNKPPPPPPPLKIGGSVSSLKLSPVPPKGFIISHKTAESSSSTENEQVKLKPLPRDKVNVESDNSMVWNKINRGSLSFDGDLTEALFGYVATNRRSPKTKESTLKSISANSKTSEKIFILENQESQNTAIVLKSLDATRELVVDALREGHGLSADTLEKLDKIAPSKEEQSLILEFDGDPTRLADAESFLYSLLKAVPSAFTRVNAMRFRLNYNTESLHVKECLVTIESGCKELRTRGLFTKLLEAVLKAGHRLNAGTSRANAEAFNLNALRKLSDVKSIDGKTTLLHFVVQEVVRYEGKRCVIARDRSVSRSNQRSDNGSNSQNTTSQDETEKEYVKLGLAVVGGLSTEFSNVKKAAALDYDTFAKKCSSLTSCALETRQLVSECALDGKGKGFVKEMDEFLNAAEEELKEQARIMDLVRRTSRYYQTGGSKDRGAHPFEIFCIIREFLDLVDQVCVEIARNLQKKSATAGSESSLPLRTPLKFPKLPPNFFSDNSSTSSELNNASNRFPSQEKN